MEETIPLRVGNDSGDPPILERVPARRLSSSRFLLLRSPGLVEGLAAGDEIEVVDERRFVVKQRGGNVCVWVYFERELDRTATDALRGEVEKLGGYLDGGTHASLIFTIPASAGLKRIESVFERLVDPTTGMTWMFGNVYDPVDGRTPLGWWKSPAGMTTDEALEFLRLHTPLPADADLSDELISDYDRVREFLLRHPDTRSIPLLLHSFGDGSGYGVYQLVEDVIRQFPKATVVPHLRTAIESPGPGVRYWAIQMTSSFADPSLVQPLLRSLDHPDADIRSAAADALAFVGDETIREVLEERLRVEEEAGVRTAIAAALADLRRA